MWHTTISIIYLVNQRRPLVQLDDAFAVLAATSVLTMSYKRLNSDGFEEYLDSNLYKKKITQYEVGTYSFWNSKNKYVNSEDHFYLSMFKKNNILNITQTI